MLNEYSKILDREGKIYLRIKVIPSAAKSELIEIMADETFKIAVAAPPEKDKANRELVKFLASEFSLNKSDIRIISGKTQRIKLLRLIKA